MKEKLLINGRLAWPPVLLAIFISLTIVAFDLIWRMFTVSAEALSLGLAAVLLVGCGAIVIVARMNSGDRR